MIKDSVCIPLWDVGKIFITKPNTNSELTATIFGFLGNFSTSLTALLLSTLKAGRENDVKFWLYVIHFQYGLPEHSFPLLSSTFTYI